MRNFDGIMEPVQPVLGAQEPRREKAWAGGGAPVPPLLAIERRRERRTEERSMEKERQADRVGSIPFNRF
jgi:hypothetical protein